MTASSSVAAAALILFRSTFAQLLFGSEQYISLVLILPPLMFGVGLYSVGYDYLRGRAQFVAANCFSLVIQAIVPLASVLAGGSVERVVLTMAVCWIAISLAVLSLIPMSIIGLRPCVREVIRYGVPRAPGDLLQLGLLAAPAIIATHLADLRVAGLVALGISALTMVGSGVSPIAFILLPFSARKLGAGQVESLRRHVLNILQVVVVIIALGTVLVEAFATQLVRLYLGPDFAAGSYVGRIMLLGAVPYAVYFTLKSVVDAQHIRAINTRNMLAASMTFVIAVGIADIIRLTVPAVLAALVASLYVLSALTTLEAMKALRTVPTASGGQGPCWGYWTLKKVWS